jgi:hypothetical protein
LEALLKTKKEFQDKANLYKVELAEYGAHLIAANTTKNELETVENNRQACQRELQDLDERLDHIEEKVRR